MPDHDESSVQRAARYGHLPDSVPTERFVVEVPALPDDRPAPPPLPPAAAPELIAATQIADARARQPIRRSGTRIGLVVGGVPLLCAFLLAGIVALFG